MRWRIKIIDQKKRSFIINLLYNVIFKEAWLVVSCRNQMNTQAERHMADSFFLKVGDIRGGSSRQRSRPPRSPGRSRAT
jgi:hypothetical protein